MGKKVACGFLWCLKRPCATNKMSKKMKIARVFPTRTSMSPIDKDAYFGPPGLFASQGYDEIHISTVFTWDIEKAEWLKDQWEMIAPVKIGGPGTNGESSDEFEPSMYLKKGIVVTSRGCPNSCSWCMIREPLKELEVKNGNNIIDNNLLACSDSHLDRVFSMLSNEKRIKFTGGLEASRVTDKIAERIRGLRIDRIYLAFDHMDRLPELKNAMKTLKKYFTRRYLFCYVLIGFYDDTLMAAEERLKLVWSLGAIPFAMRYRTTDTSWANTFLFKDRAWNLLTRTWSRPAAIKAKMKGEGQ